MIFRQLYDPGTSTYTYLIGDEGSRQAALVDPVREQLERDLKLLRELELELVYVLDTHVHADHVTAAGNLRAKTGAKTIGGARAAQCSDLKAAEGDTFRLGAIEIQVLETPGLLEAPIATPARTRATVYGILSHLAPTATAVAMENRIMKTGSKTTPSAKSAQIPAFHHGELLGLGWRFRVDDVPDWDGWLAVAFWWR